MRTSLIVAFAAASFVAASALPTPAVATDKDQAPGPSRPTRVVRDHRGQTQNQIKPLKFSGTRDGHDPGWGNYGPKKGTGDVIVRDHRH